jgi:putative SOS response-associated peptidase YedK
MCGRFTLRQVPYEWVKQLALPIFSPRYNIAPTQQVLAIRQRDGVREAVELRWGLVPSWADDPKIGNRLINARAETVATKPAFRKAYERRRCLILADGFYEWKKQGKAKQPYFIHRPDDQPFAFAGLWEWWKGNGLEIASCTIITTAANAMMRPLHDRMPVILDEQDHARWLDATQEADDLLRPAPEELLEAYPVSTKVNSPANEGAELIQPIAAL